MLSHLGNELLIMVRERPASSVAVSLDRYSVGYSVDRALTNLRVGGTS